MGAKAENPQILITQIIAVEAPPYEMNRSGFCLALPHGRATALYFLAMSRSSKTLVLSVLSSKAFLCKTNKKAH
jgi:hypothetical protein